jgi:transcriptional regulator with XRE-family HTH domain
VSQAFLAERVGLSQNFVAMIERGERNLSIDSLNKLATALEIPAGCLAMLGTSPTTSMVTGLQKFILHLIVAETKASPEVSNQHLEAAIGNKQGLDIRETEEALQAAAKKTEVDLDELVNNASKHLMECNSSSEPMSRDELKRLVEDELGAFDN